MEYNGTGIPAPSPEIAKKIGELKNVGNTKFRNRHFNDAITKYTEALTFSNQRPPWDSGQLIAEESSVLLCNRVACFLEVEKYREAYWDTEVVVRLKRNWGKGYFRRGKALIGMGCYKEAVESLELAHVFDPTGQEIKTALESAKKML
ncbi:Translocation protein sec72 [Zancudomyces culisetae]|uniref:Translocation protein sec72 n=1 Tax=Zancudomyces culisetae TaxID=1213189 RepID=A0A1R1PQU2_ZANCU|nr:Translocation protein sec72 [Zancudomyces culisetae]|eukprot:OMH83242.1 Translocation protein sec72 [Zancudomyces culisetae]